MASRKTTIASAKKEAVAAAAPKPFSVALLSIYDPEAEVEAKPDARVYPAEIQALIDERRAIAKEPQNLAVYAIDAPEQLGQLIDMRRSYKKDADINRDVETGYRYDLTLVGGGCELTVDYSSPSEIEVTVCSKGAKANEDAGTDKLCILANLSYKKTTGELKVSKLSLVLGVDTGAAAPSKTDLADRLERAVGMFRHIRSIAPLAIGEKLKTTVKVMGALSAAEKAAFKQQMNDFDIVRKI